MAGRFFNNGSVDLQVERVSNLVIVTVNTGRIAPVRLTLDPKEAVKVAVMLLDEAKEKGQ